MAIRSVKDVADAYTNGKWHTQRFMKNAFSASGDGSWYDWAFASGQPAYDARVGGAALSLVPVTATGNDAIWFPGIEAGEERRLAGMSFTSATSGGTQTNIEVIVYDLIGYYPLIDGDSTDIQTFINTQTLPRYSDGAGVRAVLVNHVAPQVTSGGTHTINYTDADGVDRSGTFGIQNNGQNRVNSRIPSATATGSGDLTMALNGRGVRRINSIQYGAAPGGLQAIYLVRPLCQISHRAGADIQNSPVMTDMCFCSDRSFDLPVILDGASLGLFVLANGSTRIVTQLYGTARFIWG